MPPFKPTSGLTSKGVRRIAETDPTAIDIQRAETRESGLTREGINRIAEVQAAPLTTQQRKSLPKSDFVFPEKAPGPGSYPINDRDHGGRALQRSSGKPEEATVKRVVCKRYPTLPKCDDDGD